MTYHDDLDRQLTDMVRRSVHATRSRYLPEMLERTRHTRQRPAWASLERWLPMAVITRPQMAAPLRLAWLLSLAVLLVAAASSVAIVGSGLIAVDRTDDGLRATGMIPQGDEALFALASEGDIYTMRADGTEVRRLTEGPANDSRPVWSPDGTRIAYHEWQDGADALVVIEADGTRTTLATNDQLSEDCVTNYWSTAWSPDGSSLIYPTRDGCEGGFALYIVAADGSTPPVPLLEPGLNSLRPAWSPDGTQLAYLASEGDANAGLYVADVTPAEALSGGIRGRLVASDIAPDLLASIFDDQFEQPVWSPDGAEIAVAAVPTGFFLIESQGIHIVEADGSGQRLLAERAGNPQWSPDGTQIAFHRVVDEAEYFNGRPCTVRTFIVDVDGTGERQLDEIGDGCDSPPLWSPDGTRLANMLIATTPDQPQPGFRLGFVMVDGSRPALILQDGRGTWQPVVARPPAALPEAAASPTS